MRFHDHPPLRINDLGQGWEETERALAAAQADFSATIDDAPTLILLWRDGEDGEERHGYVGKAADWYFGADGGFELSRDYAESVMDIADQVQGAVADNLLGQLWAWPLCPDDERLLTARRDGDGRCIWVCQHRDGHVVSEIGSLRRR
jgi:hypothetical protein